MKIKENTPAIVITDGKSNAFYHNWTKGTVVYSTEEDHYRSPIWGDMYRFAANKNVSGLRQVLRKQDFILLDNITKLERLIYGV